VSIIECLTGIRVLIIDKVKEVFAFAPYKVANPSLAPVASRLEDMPDDFTIKYLDKWGYYCRKRSESDLKKITEDLLRTYFNDDDASEISSLDPPAILSADAQANGSVDNPSYSRVKYDESMKNKLKVVCDRQMQVEEMSRLILPLTKMRYCSMLEES
jgi:hypothetical protein